MPAELVRELQGSGDLTFVGIDGDVQACVADLAGQGGSGLGLVRRDVRRPVGGRVAAETPRDRMGLRFVISGGVGVRAPVVGAADRSGCDHRAVAEELDRGVRDVGVPRELKRPHADPVDQQGGFGALLVAGDHADGPAPGGRETPCEPGPVRLQDLRGPVVGGIVEHGHSRRSPVAHGRPCGGHADLEAQWGWATAQFTWTDGTYEFQGSLAGGGTFTELATGRSWPITYDDLVGSGDNITLDGDGRAFLDPDTGETLVTIGDEFKEVIAQQHPQWADAVRGAVVDDPTPSPRQQLQVALIDGSSSPKYVDLPMLPPEFAPGATISPGPNSSFLVIAVTRVDGNSREYSIGEVTAYLIRRT